MQDSFNRAEHLHLAFIYSKKKMIWKKMQKCRSTQRLLMWFSGLALDDDDSEITPNFFPLVPLMPCELFTHILSLQLTNKNACSLDRNPLPMGFVFGAAKCIEYILDGVRYAHPYLYQHEYADSTRSRPIYNVYAFIAHNTSHERPSLYCT